MSRPPRLYAALLRLYPVSFRARFADEMLGVFAQSWSEKRLHGFWVQLGGLVFELFDLSLSLTREHWRALLSEEEQMTASSEINLQPGGAAASLGGRRPAPSWGRAFLGGLPFLLAGIFAGSATLFVGLGLFRAGSQADSVLFIATGLLLGLAVLFSLILAWRERGEKATWVATWYSFWMWAVIILLDRVVIIFDLNTYMIGWFVPLALAYFLYKIACRDALQGVLAALPMMLIVWTPFLEMGPYWEDGHTAVGTAWLAGGLLAGLAAVIALRSNRPIPALGVTLVTTAVIGIYFSYLGTYQGGALPFSEPGPNPGATFRAYLPMLALSFCIVLAPAMASRLRQLGRLSQAKGGAIYRLALLGLLVMFFGSLIESPMMASENLRESFPLLTAIFDWLIEVGLYARFPQKIVWLGGIIYMIGYLLLTLTLRRTATLSIRSAWLRYGLLFPALLGAPLVLYLTNPANMENYPPSSPLWYFLDILWLVLATWLVLDGFKQKSGPPAIARFYTPMQS